MVDTTVVMRVAISFMVLESIGSQHAGVIFSEREGQKFSMVDVGKSDCRTLSSERRCVTSF
jgi:hypothetical protein